MLERVITGMSGKETVHYQPLIRIGRACSMHLLAHLQWHHHGVYGSVMSILSRSVPGSHELWCRDIYLKGEMLELLVLQESMLLSNDPLLSVSSGRSRRKLSSTLQNLVDLT